MGISRTWAGHYHGTSRGPAREALAAAAAQPAPAMLAQERRATAQAGALLLGAANGRAQVLCPQGLDQVIDAATVLDHGGELRALGYAHAYAFYDDVDDGEIAVGMAQSPIDGDVLGRGHVDLAVHNDGTLVLGAGACDLDDLAQIPAEACRDRANDKIHEQLLKLRALRIVG